MEKEEAINHLEEYINRQTEIYGVFYAPITDVVVKTIETKGGLDVYTWKGLLSIAYL